MATQPASLFHYIRLTLSALYVVIIPPLYFIAWLIIRITTLPFGQVVYQRLDDLLYSTYLRNILFITFNITGSKIHFSGDWQSPELKKKRILYVANHLCDVDWIISSLVAIQQGGCVEGHLRFIWKDCLRFIPLFGFLGHQHGCIFVHLKSFKANTMLKGLHYLKENSEIPSWLVIFPEGGRLYPDDKKMIEGSEDRAKRNNFPILKYHLTPKSKGTYLILEELCQYFDAVCDVTCVYGNSMDQNGMRVRAPSIVDFFVGKCPFVHIHIKTLPVKNIPLDEKGLAQWMHNLFQNKDKLVESFYSPDAKVRESVLKESTEHPVALSQTLPSVVLYLAILFYVFYFHPWFYVQTLILGSICCYIWLMIRPVC